MNAISFNVANELVEQIARRAAELLTAQSSERADDGWLRGAERSPPTSTLRARVSMRLSRPSASPSTMTARR